ncbi:MAG: CapA family protein [Patescibacteria group bacterium]
MKRRLLYFLFAVVFIGILGFGGLLGVKNFQMKAEEVSNLSEAQQIVLLFGGDIMLDRGVEWAIKKNGGDWRWPFLKIADTLHGADLVFGNLESQISDKGRNVGSRYSFRADPKSMEGLVYAGFDVVSVANNHSFDYTKEAFEDSLLRIKEAGIAYTGGGFSSQEAYFPAIREVKGIRVGFLGYTNSGSASWSVKENQAGIVWTDWNTLEQLERDIQQAKRNVDILVVSLHGGEEYAKEPNEFQKAFAKTAIDAGANLIIGHHPHVVQPLEQYQQGWIAYSLGNFVFDQYFSQETMRGAMLKAIVEKKTIKEVSLVKTKLNPSYQVELAE